MTSIAHPAHLLAIGGAHIDRRGRTDAPFVAGASNPGSMAEEIGGGAFNAVRSAVQRGVDASIVSLRGGDMAGEAVARAIAAARIRDRSAIFLDRATPSYTALLDNDGELIAGLADMSLYEIGFPRQLRRRAVRDAIAEADAVLVDANLPAVALRGVAEAARGARIFAIAISPAKVMRLASLLPSLSCLFLNRREAAALTGLAPEAPAEEMLAELRARGLARATISAGRSPLAALDGEEIFAIAPPAVERVADVTGAGDSLAGATIAALLRGQAFAQALREGLAAAKICIESPASVPELGEPGFSSSLAAIPEPRPLSPPSKRKQTE